MSVKVHGTMDKYVRVPWEFLANPENPTNERGLFATLLGLPPDWEFSIRGLTKILPEGKGSINRMLSNLQKKGYVKLVQNRAPNGHFGKTDLIIDLNPPNSLPDPQQQAGKRAPINRDPEKRDPVEWPESNIKESIINKSIIKESYNTPESRVRKPNIKKPEEAPEIGSGTKNPAHPESLLYIDKPCQIPGKNRFNNFKQRHYNFDFLEKQLNRP